MDRIIRQITDRLVSALPENENYYRIQNLDQYGFPPFLVRRIHIELQWNLDESMILPKTDWANTQSDAVQQSWQRFLSAIHAEVQLPASYARAVIETAVADVIEILIQPRKSIPEILYGGEDVLSAAQIHERTELLVVYPHFARVLTTYMERKEKGALNRELCKDIIVRVDEKITGNYTPLQWAQMLDPLFTLGGNEIDTNLFRLFFEDKKRRRAARKFDLMNDTISRAAFIEVLSSPEMLNYEGYEEDQSELFSGEGETGEKNVDAAESDEESEAAVPEKAEAETESSVDDTEEELSAPEYEEAFDRPDQTEAQQDGEVEDSDEGIEESEEKHSMPEDEEQEEPEDEPEPVEENSRSLNEIFVDEEEEPVQEEEEPEEEEVSDEPESIEADEEETGESAIWQRFLDSDEDDANGHGEDLSDEPLYDDEYIDEPIIDLTEDESVSGEKESLDNLLESERTYYVDELFGGSEQAYDEALGKIAEKDDWKSASKEIQNNIFKRNMVNIYSEPAVDFTDRLQTYFLEKQNHNKDQN